MIRPAEVSDIPRLLEMGEKFAAKARLEDHVGYDPASMAATFEAMIEGDNFALFIGENGAIGGIIAPHPFNYSQKFVDELFWWSEGREGIRLLRTFEDWADSQGAIKRMSVLESVEADRTGNLLERMGYAPLERSYIKVK